MVYFDINHSFEEPKSQDTSLQKAPVLDRVFSLLLDYMVFSPFIAFLLLLFFKNEFYAWKTMSLGEESTDAFINVVMFSTIAFSFLQSFFIYKYGATPGQYFLKIQTRFDEATGVRFVRVLLRQLLFWCSGLFLGLPWLAILAHPEHQSFYDRITGAKVVTLKTEAHYFTFEIETKYWQSFVATLVLFVLTIGLVLLGQDVQEVRNSAVTLKKLKNEKYLCREFQNLPLKERLKTAIALNLVGQVDDKCLDHEANFILWKSTDEELRSLAYYAKSLTQAGEADEATYQKQACQGESLKSTWGCKIASAFRLDTLEDLYKELKVSDEKSLLKSVLKYELSLSLNKNSESKIMFQELKKYDSNQQVKKYLISEILSNQNQNSDSQRSPAQAQDSDDISYAQELVGELK